RAAGKRIRRWNRARERHPPSSAIHHAEEGAHGVHRRAGGDARADQGKGSVSPEITMQKTKKVALAYSGGLDTSVIIPWLKENYACEVVAVAVDVGQADETAGLADKAYRTGACEFYLIDAKEEFAADY